MFRASHQISDVVYNPAEQAFEARVTFHTSDGRATYGARFHAPLDTEFDKAAQGILADARRQSRHGGSLRAFLKPVVTRHDRVAPAQVTGTFSSRAA